MENSPEEFDAGETKSLELKIFIIKENLERLFELINKEMKS